MPEINTSDEAVTENAVTSEADSMNTAAAHKPLAPGKYVLLLLSATAIIVFFYIYAALALVLIGIAILVCVALIVGGAQTGGAVFFTAPAHALLGCALAILRSLNLKSETQRNIVLTADEAPALFAMVELTAGLVGVRPPNEIRLLHDDNAWVNLRGLRRGPGRVTLAVGLKLLAELTVSEIQAVIAHEMAHAKLIQRGYQAVAYRGIARINRLVDALRYPPQQRDLRTYKAFKVIGGWLAFVPGKLAEVGTKLVALSSRQEEFLADQLAAQICGSEIYKQTLIRIHAMGPRSSRLSWRDHILHRGPGYIEWLQDALAARDPGEQAEAERRALADNRRSDFGTHPVLSDRLAALTASPAPGTTFPASGLSLLADADKSGERLIAEIERLAILEEQRANKELRRWLRKKGKSRSATPAQAAGAAAFIAGAVMLFWLVVTLDSRPALQVWQNGGAGLTLLISGVWLYRFGRARDVALLPVPPYDLWDASLDARPAQREAENWRASIAAELRAALPAEITRKAGRRQWWLERSYEALAVCDYQRADVASRLALEADRKSLHCLAPHCITSAYFGPTGLERESVTPLFLKLGIGPSMSWAVAWIQFLSGNWEAAEIYLLDAVERRPEEATLHSLLAIAHCNHGKIREGLESSNRAVALEPEGTTHRLTRARLLLAAGRLEPANEDIAWLEARGEGRIEFLVARVEAAVAQGNEEQAESLAQQTYEAFPKAATRLQLAAEFGHSQSESMRRHAATQYEAVLQEGFYPEAEMGLARIFYREENRPAAREHMLAALNIERERPEEAAHPLSVLSDVSEGLRALDDSSIKCSAWKARLALPQELAKVTGVELTVCHATRPEAIELVRELSAAILPGWEWDQESLTWTELEPKERPTDLITPGIYRHEWT